MNKQEYLQELEKELKACHVQDTADIIEEYEAHFAFKQADGYTEEEIAAKLARPKEIAAQFALIKQPLPGRKDGRAVLAVGLGLADIAVTVFFIVLFAWVLVMGAFSFTSAALGICLIGKLNIAGLIPSIPYLGSLLLGIGCMALAVLSAIATVYCHLYVTQLAKAYLHWRKSTLAVGASAHLSPPLPKHPQLSGKMRRRMRSVSLLALAVFGICFITGLIVLFAGAGSLEPWHTWNWFQ